MNDEVALRRKDPTFGSDSVERPRAIESYSRDRARNFYRDCARHRNGRLGSSNAQPGLVVALGARTIG